MSGNMLYYGENLGVLRRDLKDESVDLVYQIRSRPEERAACGVAGMTPGGQ
jgi:hypothetical protein